MIAVVFCQRLRELRLKSNFKQEYVALYLGISQPSYCRLEKGMVDGVSLKMIDVIAKLYEVSPSYLFSDKSETQISFTNKINFAHSPQPTAHTLSISQPAYTLLRWIGFFSKIARPRLWRFIPVLRKYARYYNDLIIR